MKKLLTIVVLGLICSNVVYAETWSCVYQFNNESRQMILERRGNKFHQIFDSNTIDNIGMNIINETNNFIHLYRHIDSVFIVILDKPKKNFVMVGLNYKNSTKVIEGKCTIF